MKKFICCLFKAIALLALLAAAVYGVIAYWDKITELWAKAKTRLCEEKACICRPSEYDDYAD